MNWVVGVTTAPRKDPQLAACLKSLIVNGWKPIVFAEPGTDVAIARTLNLTVIQWKEKKGCWHNWLAMSKALLAANPDTDAILTVQDDTVFHPEARAFFETQGGWPIDKERLGFFSFYAAKHYQYRYQVVRPNGTIVEDYPSEYHARKRAINEKKYPGRKIVPIPIKAGPHRIKTKSFWGACALAFPRESLRAIVNHRTAREWKGANGHSFGSDLKNSDTAIGQVCNILNLEMWTWNPSLAQHVAKFSAIGHGGNKGRRHAQRMVKDPWVDATPEQRMAWVSYSDMDAMCARLAAKLPKDISAVAGVPRSGLVPAFMLANHLHVPLVPIDSLRSREKAFRPEVSRKLREVEGRVLVVDDCIDSGKAMAEAVTGIRVPYCTAAAIATTRGKQSVDFCGDVIGTPRTFAWNWTSIQHVERTLFDMDGVICEDWNGGRWDSGPKWNEDRDRYEVHVNEASPLYLPRRKVLAVVTGRPECVRKQTEAWLARHGVEYGNLVMRDDLDDRKHSVIKANAYKRIPLATCFVESSEEQSREIAKLTGRSVLSVETWKMHNAGVSQ